MSHGQIRTPVAIKLLISLHLKAGIDLVAAPSPATIFPHTPRTLLGYACSPSNAFRRPTISIITPPGREASRKTVTVSTRPLIASVASESPALIPLDKAS